MSALVGRDQPAAVLDGEVGRTLTSHGGLVLVAGEAGIGKSSLVAGAVEAARSGGALVAVGTCWDREGAPGHWPWVQVVRALARLAPTEAWEAARGEAGGELGALLGGDGTSLGGTADEFGLHDAVTTLLVALARRQPLVVVVEDLHWADEASLRLLEFAARHGWYERLLLVGTYRDVEVDTGDHPRAPGIAALVARATTLTLTGLDRDQVGALVRATTGRTPSDAVIDDLHRRTGGNPFFVEQTARLWVSRGAVDAVPPGVRDVVEHRLALVAPETRGALVTTALLGHAVTRPVLAAALDIEEEGVDAALGEAVAAGLLDPTEAGHAFVHDLVRETLADGLDEADARRRHAGLVDRLEGGAGVTPGDLAHHAHHAGEAVDLDRRVALLQAAARHAAGRMAIDEALVHLRRALSAIPAERPRERAFALVELGWTVLRSGDIDRCRQVFEEATRLALDLDDPSLLTRTALSLRAAVWLVATDEAQVTAAEMVDEAHRRLLVEGGRPTAAATPWEREQELTALALDMCRSSGDDQALWDALNARHDALWTPGTVADRVALTEEMIAVARRNDAAGLEVEALHFHLLDLIEAGDPRVADEHATFQARARQIDSAWSRSLARWTGALVAQLGGRFDDARSLLDESLAIDTRSGLTSDDVTSLHLQVRWAVDQQQGRDDAVDALLDRIAEVHPHPELLRALTALERGDVPRAARTVADLRGTGAEPGRWFAPLWIRLQAEVAGATGDAALAAELRPLLAPLAGQWALMAQGAIDGPFDLWAGVVELGQGCADEAVARFTAAAASADALGARAWAVEARTRLLAARRARGDEPAALAADATAIAQEARTLGLARVVEALAGFAPEPAPPPAAPAEVGVEVPPPAGNVFRRVGDVWELGFAGTSAHVPDAKGIRDIHLLLGRPGMGVRAVDLLDPEAGAAGRAARSMGGDDVLDERAKIAYRTRLTRLDEDIDAALARGADRRAAELDRERAALIDELRRATGLGGRSRRLGDDAERARKAVRERIRDTIRRLSPVHPALADHLREAIRTGATCSYEPADPIEWSR
jgi:tetratricopeptide (TPR) repeat protein